MDAPKNGVTVHATPDGDYSILVPNHDGDEATKTRYRVFGSRDFVFVDAAEDRIVFGPTVQLCLSPLAAHALAEALHAKANALEGKPADEPFTAPEPPEVEDALIALGPIHPPTFI